ncbi:MAG: hypothetical protein MUF24_04920 [Chitinophagaceae bacterium]|nr:hypothetical protein [Chitinophagaceae bacterium]
MTTGNPACEALANGIVTTAPGIFLPHSTENSACRARLSVSKKGVRVPLDILLFHPKPEKYITGAYVKIGYFENEADLIFQDEVHGNLFEQIEQIMDLLFSKYIKALISYEGISRVETYEYPKEAVREALLNAIAHKDYSGGIPIQIKVYKDRILIWNDGQLPENWTIQNLLKNHQSKPYNPDISNTLFRSGYIESWGRGIEKMINFCREAKIPEPKYSFTGSDFLVEFRKDIYNEEDLKSLGLTQRQVKAVIFAKETGKITNSDYQELNKVSKRTATRELTELVSVFKTLIRVGTSGSNITYKIV